ncbi:hypothetical protein L0F63_004879, partial [Massospora cicadina]
VSGMEPEVSPVEASQPVMAYRGRYRGRGREHYKARDFEERERSRSREIKKIIDKEASRDTRIRERERGRRF